MSKPKKQKENKVEEKLNFIRQQNSLTSDNNNNSINNNDWLLFVFLYGLRILNGFLIKNSYYYPDEYFQSVEISHSDYYGSGYRSWEWDKQEPIRSPMYPMIFWAFYWIMEKLGLDNSFIIAHGPRLIVQSLLACLMDLFTIKYYRDFIGKPHLMLLIICFSSFAGLNLPTRTLANCTEATLFIIAFYYYQFNNTHSHFSQEILARFIITLNFIIRSTSLIIWPFLFLFKIIITFKQPTITLKYILLNIMHAILSILLTLLLDSLYFNQITFTPYNFINWNIIQGKSKLFSQEPWHHFITVTLFEYFQLYSIIFGFALIAFIFQSKQKQLVSSFFIYITIISCSGHKENRFIMGIYPIFTIILSYFFALLQRQKQYLSMFLLSYLAIYSNLNAFYQKGMYKDQGSIELADYLRTFDKEVKNIVVFYGCYNSPLNSIVHKNVNIDIPKCLPHDSQDIVYQEHYTLKYLQMKINNFKPQMLVIENRYLNNEEVRSLINQSGYVSQIKVNKHRNWDKEYYQVFYNSKIK